jgi:hypothetical protein
MTAFCIDIDKVLWIHRIERFRELDSLVFRCCSIPSSFRITVSGESANPHERMTISRLDRLRYTIRPGLVGQTIDDYSCQPTKPSGAPHFEPIYSRNNRCLHCWRTYSCRDHHPVTDCRSLDNKVRCEIAFQSLVSFIPKNHSRIIGSVRMISESLVPHDPGTR